MGRNRMGKTGLTAVLAAVDPQVFGDAEKMTAPLALAGVSAGQTVTFAFDGAEEAFAAETDGAVTVTFRQAGVFAASVEK